MIDSQGTNVVAELRILERPRPDELQFDAPRAEVLPGVEFHTADGVHVGIRPDRFTQGEHLVLAFQVWSMAISEETRISVSMPRCSHV